MARKKIQNKQEKPKKTSAAKIAKQKKLKEPTPEEIKDILQLPDGEEGDEKLEKIAHELYLNSESIVNNFNNLPKDDQKSNYGRSMLMEHVKLRHIIHDLRHLAAYKSGVMNMVIPGEELGEVLDITQSNVLESIIKDLLELPNKVEEVLKLDKKILEISKKMFKEKDAFFIGRGIDYATSQEASLKLKEISYIHSESNAAGELKHGTIALIEKGVNVIGIMTDKNLVKKTISNIEEVITRGALTTVVVNKSIGKEIDTKIFTNIVEVPETSIFLSPIITVIPLQLLSYYISKEKGLDVDKPRNLAKSVTVE